MDYIVSPWGRKESDTTERLSFHFILCVIRLFLSYAFFKCLLILLQYCFWGFPDGSSIKEHVCSAGDVRDMSVIPGSGRSPGGGDPLQYSCLENPMDRGAWWLQSMARGHKFLFLNLC